MTAASLAFTPWPDGAVSVRYDPGGFATRLRGFFESWDLDNRFVWTPDVSARNGLQVQTSDKAYAGFRALRMIVLLNPITFFAMAASIASLGDFPGAAALLRRLIVGTSLVLLMPPLAWIADVWWDRRKPGSRSAVRIVES
jgi:hypothetical protein